MKTNHICTKCYRSINHQLLPHCSQLTDELTDCWVADDGSPAGQLSQVWWAMTRQIQFTSLSSPMGWREQQVGFSLVQSPNPSTSSKSASRSVSAEKSQQSEHSHSPSCSLLLSCVSIQWPLWWQSTVIMVHIKHVWSDHLNSILNMLR